MSILPTFLFKLEIVMIFSRQLEATYQSSKSADCDTGPVNVGYFQVEMICFDLFNATG